MQITVKNGKSEISFLAKEKRLVTDAAAFVTGLMQHAPEGPMCEAATTASVALESLAKLMNPDSGQADDPPAGKKEEPKSSQKTLDGTV